MSSKISSCVHYLRNGFWPLALGYELEAASERCETLLGRTVKIRIIEVVIPHTKNRTRRMRKITHFLLSTEHGLRIAQSHIIHGVHYKLVRHHASGQCVGLEFHQCNRHSTEIIELGNVTKLMCMNKYCGPLPNPEFVNQAQLRLLSASGIAHRFCWPICDFRVAIKAALVGGGICG